MDDLLGFLALLPSNDKRLAVLAGLAHVAALGLRRHLLWTTTAEFFDAA